ncbi:MAG: YraN family protein [Synergistaceae bacterium]|nr:YraN family protein [Synergistaceae bacterium]MBR0035802.1 YraN family protein [Synergistaceae bacterium]
MNTAHKLGLFAEDAAAEYLVSIGWRVIARNVRNQYGELDIIALDAKTQPQELVIVEVRCRTLGKIQTPIETIGFRKLRTLLRASQEYVDSLGWSGFWRIDIIGITLQDKNTLDNWELEHIKDITS